MKRALLAAAFAALASVAAPATPAAAQLLGPVRLQIGGGAILPTGSLSEDADPGYRVEGGALLGAGASSPGLRASVAYDVMGHAHGGGGDFTRVSGTLQLVHRLPGLLVTPYLLAGGGVIRLERPPGHGASEAGWEPGVDIGAGLEFRLGGVDGFLEARWQSSSSDGEAVRFIPVTVGIRF